jgi:hypothetical protein
LQGGYKKKSTGAREQRGQTKTASQGRAVEGETT